MTPAPILPADGPDDGYVPSLSGHAASDTPARDATPVLTAAQRIVVWELANGVSGAKAAKKAGVCDKTVYRWMRKPEMKAALEEAAGIVADVNTPSIEAARSRLAGKSIDVANELVRLATQAGSEMVRVIACGRVLESVGIGGKAQQQTNVQVNVDVQQQVANDMDEAKRIIAEVSSGRQASPNS